MTARNSKAARLRAILAAMPGNSCEVQRARIIEALSQCTTFTTDDARRYLDVFAPASRVIELRRAGVDIGMVKVWANTESAKPHRIGLYFPGAGAGA